MSIIDIILILVIFPSTLFALGGVVGILIPQKRNRKNTNYSIIIPFRNEVESLKNCIDSIEKSITENSELILINDHSDQQNTDQITKWLENKTIQWKLIHLSSSKRGKRDALKLGINEAKFQKIISSDADCIWNKKAMECISSSHEKKLTLITVLYKNENFFLNSFLQSELLILNSYGAAYAKMSLPFLASGAAMSFDKSDFLDYLNNSESKHYPSGDDMYFLEFMIRRYGRRKIEHQVLPDVFVYTESPQTLSEYFQQRARWGRKAPKLKNAVSFIAAIATTLYCFSFLATLIVIPFQSISIAIVILLLLKILFETVIGILSSQKLHYPIKIHFLPMVPILSPILFMAISTRIISMKDAWKGRKQ